MELQKCLQYIFIEISSETLINLIEIGIMSELKGKTTIKISNKAFFRDFIWMEGKVRE